MHSEAFGFIGLLVAILVQPQLLWKISYTRTEISCLSSSRFYVGFRVKDLAWLRLGHTNTTNDSSTKLKSRAVLLWSRDNHLNYYQKPPQRLTIFMLRSVVYSENTYLSDLLAKTISHSQTPWLSMSFTSLTISHSPTYTNAHEASLPSKLTSLPQTLVKATAQPTLRPQNSSMWVHVVHRCSLYVIEKRHRKVSKRYCCSRHIFT